MLRASRITIDCIIRIMPDQTISRRHFLKLGAASIVAAGLAGGCRRGVRPERIGLALGGGGARGLAHILIFEALEELGIRPYRIAGTSIGAVMGALYAAGLTSNDIRALVDELTVSRDESWLESLFRERLTKWLDFFDLRDSGGGLVSTRGFVDYLLEAMGKTRFGQLEIPLKVIATDFWAREQVVFRRGELGPAIAASMAIPGVFAPVEHDGRVLVDGGLVNPLPYDVLMDSCDLTIAVDVQGRAAPRGGEAPTYFETTFNSLQIMAATITRARLDLRPPDIYLAPDIRNVRVLDFYRFEEIFRQTKPAKAALKRELGRRLT